MGPDFSKRNFNIKKDLFSEIPNLILVTPSQWLANLLSYSLEAFDNDAPMTFSLTGNINLVTYWGSSPLLLSDGALNLVHVDKKLAQKILKLKDEEIVNSLKLILSKIQVWFVCKRIHKMQKAIKHTMQKSADFFISDTEWNEKTIKEPVRKEW